MTFCLYYNAILSDILFGTNFVFTFHRQIKLKFKDILESRLNVLSVEDCCNFQKILNDYIQKYTDLNKELENKTEQERKQKYSKIFYEPLEVGKYYVNNIFLTFKLGLNKSGFSEYKPMEKEILINYSAVFDSGNNSEAIKKAL